MTDRITARKIADPLQKRAWLLGFFGLCRRWPEVADLPEIERIITLEEQERRTRSLERRVTSSKIGRFKPMADFDWTWPESIDREAVDELLTLQFVADATNPVLIGPSGIGKTMIAKNVAHRALLAGHTVRFTTAAAMLGQLAETDSPSQRRRLLAALGRLELLVIDEIGFLSYDHRYADLFYEVVAQRYEQHATLISTNRPFSEWNEVFPGAAVVAIVERVIHRSEVIHIKGRSYRGFEAELQAANKAKVRAARRG